ncbi:cupin domain-containing protein [Alkalihalobacillus sp. AL-G]|uniref:cupin domain-containing protein n=1 Tax=Alkalihalobacillus sp. AL-G TaxID=2926399 RepID=UPI00272986FA|nr:cupin domain-containing protein [Alkalihalobacillus sp. AL-G]WLD93330.1 cupin domain-containing protein [Alkalihalobacillus sp. AL-G]
MIKREILSAKGSLMLVRVELQEGFISNIDQHPEEQMSYIEKGTVEFEVDGVKTVLNQGDVLHIDSDKAHQVRVIEDCVILDTFNPIREDLLSKK